MATSPPRDIHKLIAALPKEAMNAGAPKMMIGASSLGSNVLGGVYTDMPNLMVLNSALSAIQERTGIKHTVPHEYEHILQNQVDMRGNGASNYDTQVLEAYASLGGSEKDLVSALRKSGSSPILREHLKKISGTQPAAYIGGMNGQMDLREQFAELSSIEAYTNKDLTKDPVVRKEFFNDDQAMIDTYKATTGYRTQRMDARDLPPMMPGKSPEVKAVNAVKNAFLPSAIDTVKSFIKNFTK